MQIHELNNFTGTLGSGAYLAIDDGTDTGKISSQGLLAATEARIDNIIAGLASSAEEIVDARLGADGVTYPSLGDAIRDQFSDVKSDLNGYISLGTLIGNKYIKTTDGTEGYEANWSCTDFIVCDDYDVLIIDAPASSEYNAFYDSSKNFISSFEHLAGRNEIAIPAGAKFVRLSNKTTDMQTTVIKSIVGTLKEDVNALESDLSLIPLAQKQGYNTIVPLRWESGSINLPSGTNKNPDANVIRTILPRFKLKGDIKFILLNDQYRIRYYYSSDLTGSVSQSSWYNAAGTYDISIDTSKYYRIQIATYNASSMDIKEALRSILIVYESDANRNVTFDNFAKELDDNAFYPVWESGGIVTTNGKNNTSADSIRTPSARIYYDDIKFIIKGNYRIRWYRYASDGTFETADGWVTTSGTFTFDKAKKYRLQIATTDSSNIDLSDALRNVVIEKLPSLGIWTNEIESKVQTINSYMTDGTDKTAFLFLTDTHWVDSTVLLNGYGINTALMKYVSDRCNVKYLIHGGDLNSEYRSNKNIARECMTRPMAMMRDAFDNVFVTRGNHDDNNEGGYDDWSYTISQSDSYSYMFRNTNDVVFGETGTYFYHDIPFEKVRIISLDCVDFPYTNEVDEDYLDEKLLAYGYTQLQWLCDVLKDTPSGYHVVIYTHAMVAPSIVTIEHPDDSPQTRAKNCLVVANILKAYKNRSNYSENISGSFSTYHSAYYTGTLSGNFTNCDATIVGVFSGHEHIDCIEEILDANGNGIGIYNTCTQNSSALFSDSVISHSYQHPMVIGTTTELVWDMVVIDRSSKHVDMIRIGAYEANTDVSAVTVRSFNYV